MKLRGLRVLIVFLLVPIAVAQTPQQGDTWEPLKFFVGKWQGSGAGEPGVSKVEREYQLVLKDKFLQVKNRSVYDPQPKNPRGEVHDGWGMISLDKNRKLFVFRQFHVEGFVNQYVTTSISKDGKTIVFTSESIENIPTGWKARETYRILSPDEFTETFELAGPGKDFSVYSETRLKRKN